MHRLLTAFVNVCQAVAHAHKRKVIHRDLKPENIAIDSFGQIVLLDWGLAKINDETGMFEVNGQAEPGDLHTVSSTHSGRVLGTPLYMAPEQAAGRLDEVDEITDVYGLGGILYAILTGEAPHQQTIDSVGEGYKTSELFSKIVAGNVAPPSNLVPDVPVELAAICTKALSNKRYLRYGSAEEVAEDVERFRAGTPVSAYQAPLKQRVATWMARHPTLTQLILLMTALMVIGAAAVGFTARRGKVALQEARYQSLTEFARELELNLQFESEELVQDSRFLTDLPLLRAITATQRPETTTSQILVHGESVLHLENTKTEEWLRRYGTLLDGLLEANPSYLVASLVSFQDTEVAELVRTERLTAGMPPRRVPQQQLYSGATDEKSEKLFQLRPGQVLLTTGDQLGEDVPATNRSPLVLVALCPIFDETGAIFGINAMELDLGSRLRNLFQAVPHENTEVFVTNATGTIAIRYRDGQVLDVKETNITQVIPQCGPFFSPDNTEHEFGDDLSVHAIRVHLGDNWSQASFGIVVRISEQQD